jgi:DNA-binding LytR/AlgR family response regulator
VKILIVEDDPIVASDLLNKLEQLGYSQNEVAHSVSEAKKTAESDTPDLAIIDIDLGRAESGIDLGQWFDTRNISYFYLSGKQDPVTFYKTAETGAAANIEKPITLSTLRNTIYLAIRKKALPLNTKKRIFIPSRDGELSVRIEDILFIRASRTYCEIQLENEQKPRLVSTSLGNMLEKINAAEIVRIHRSHAININHVRFRQGNMLSTNPEFEPLEIGKKYRSSVNQLLESL